jgi:hypothetical protein
MPFGRQRVYELPARIKTTRGGAYSDNREVPSAAKLAARRPGAPARSRPNHFGLTRTGARHSTILKVSPPSGILDSFNATQIVRGAVLARVLDRELY